MGARARHGASGRPGRGVEQRFPPQTYGPGVMWFFLLILIALWVYILLEHSSRLPTLKLVMLVLGGLFAAYACISGWRWYRLDAEGIEIRSWNRRVGWTWAEIAGVSGTTIHRGAVQTAAPVLLGGSTHVGSRVMRYDVRDAEGYLLFRISPWTGRRKKLAGEIRRRASAARQLAERTG